VRHFALPPAQIFAALAVLTVGGARARAENAKAAKPAVAALGRGYRAYRSGDYATAVRALSAAAGHGLRADDWAYFLLAESELYAGATSAARGHFARAAHGKGRAAEMAPARIADCLWLEGDRKKAARAYAAVVKTAAHKPSPFVDVAVARFRLAEVTFARDADAGRRQFLALAKELPAHPLADEALARAEPATKRAAKPAPKSEVEPDEPASADNEAPPDAAAPPSPRRLRASRSRPRIG
jgi:hypothetical protein